MKAPGLKGPPTIFSAVCKRNSALPLIAEDLGEITPDVYELRDRLQLPGMKVLQFIDGPNNPFLPHNYAEPKLGRLYGHAR